MLDRGTLSHLVAEQETAGLDGFVCAPLGLDQLQKLALVELDVAHSTVETFAQSLTGAVGYRHSYDYSA